MFDIDSSDALRSMRRRRSKTADICWLVEAAAGSDSPAVAVEVPLVSVCSSDSLVSSNACCAVAVGAAVEVCWLLRPSKLLPLPLTLLLLLAPRHEQTSTVLSSWLGTSCLYSDMASALNVLRTSSSLPVRTEQKKSGHSYSNRLLLLQLLSGTSASNRPLS